MNLDSTQNKIYFVLILIFMSFISCKDKKIKQDENELKTDSEMIATKESWKNNPLPKENIALDIEKLISTDEMDEIKKGLVPVKMEDKWFVYGDKNKIYFHRSWTGACIYQAEFEQKNSLNYEINKLTINRNTNEYKETDSSYDIKLFDFLVDRLLLGKSVKYPVRDSTLTDKQKMIEKHSTVGYGQTRKEINE